MQLVFASLRVLLAVAFVAIGGYSAQAGVGQSEAATTGGERAVSNVATVAWFSSGRLQGVNPCGSSCAHPFSSDCAHLSGFGCCAPGILVNDLPALVPTATAGGGFATASTAVAGTDPEAPQEPPKNIA